MHKRANLEGKNFDDLPEARRWQVRGQSTRTHGEDLEAGNIANQESVAKHISSSTNDTGPGSNEGITVLEIDKEKEEKSASTLIMQSEEIVVLDRIGHGIENGAANETTFLLPLRRETVETEALPKPIGLRLR